MTPGAAPPDTAWPTDVFDRRLQPASAAPIAVAVSGGGDSLAALLATKAWADRAGRRIVVITVDHGLQAGSAAWVGIVGETAHRLGADFEALTWEGDKPASGLAAAARKARHRLIAAAARRRGARVVVFGHTADDVAEAAWMRAQGASVGSPGEWGPSPAWPEGREVFLLRPLLALGRAEIREWLVAAGEAWIDDPANETASSLRARARIALGLLPSRETVAAKRTDEGTRRPIRARSKTPRRRPCDPSPGPSAHLLAQGEKAYDRADGSLVLDRSFFRAAADPIRILGAALTCAGGGDRPPPRDRLAALAGRVAADGELTATLAGAKLIGDGAQILIVRNPGETARGGLAPLRLALGETGVWDGRFEITAGDDPVIIEPLAGHARALDAASSQALRRLPAAARGALPSYADAAGRRVCPILAQGPSLRVKSLVAARFVAACGVISKEPAA